jgi:hypothetical protein
MKYTIKELSFNELVEYKVKVKQGKIKELNFDLDNETLLQTLKQNKFFRLVKSITLTHEGKKGFFVAGKKMSEFNLKRLGNLITFSIVEGKTYYIEVLN